MAGYLHSCIHTLFAGIVPLKRGPRCAAALVVQVLDTLTPRADGNAPSLGPFIAEAFKHLDGGSRDHTAALFIYTSGTTGAPKGKAPCCPFTRIPFTLRFIESVITRRRCSSTPAAPGAPQKGEAPATTFHVAFLSTHRQSMWQAVRQLQVSGVKRHCLCAPVSVTTVCPLLNGSKPCTGLCVA